MNPGIGRFKIFAIQVSYSVSTSILKENENTNKLYEKITWNIIDTY